MHVSYSPIFSSFIIQSSVCTNSLLQNSPFFFLLHMHIYIRLTPTHVWHAATRRCRINVASGQSENFDGEGQIAKHWCACCYGDWGAELSLILMVLHLTSAWPPPTLCSKSRVLNEFELNMAFKTISVRPSPAFRPSLNFLFDEITWTDLQIIWCTVALSWGETCFRSGQIKPSKQIESVFLDVGLRNSLNKNPRASSFPLTVGRTFNL